MKAKRKSRGSMGPVINPAPEDKLEKEEATLKQELEVFIKNLDCEGILKSGFIVEEDSVEEAKDDTEAQLDIKRESEDELEREISSGSSSSSARKKKDRKKRKAEEPSPKTPVVNSKIKEETSEFLTVRPRKQTLCQLQPDQKWYQVLASMDDSSDENGCVVSKEWVDSAERYAKQVLSMEVANFRQLSFKTDKNSSEKKFMKHILKSGALSDRIYATAVQIQESPVHQLSSLNHLIDMVSLKSRRPAMLCLNVLQDLFAEALLAPGRRLRSFNQCPLTQVDRLAGGQPDIKDKLMAFWLFEHELKLCYSRFLNSLSEMGKDTIEQTRMKVMSVQLELLIANPEREQDLLTSIVNKLGDPVRSVAAKAIYQLGQLLDKHPAMKGVILDEVERLLYRTNISAKAQYYGICCLTQMVLDDDDSFIAGRLVQIYFSFFKSSVKKGDIDSRLVSALLTGVHRAYPFLSSDSSAPDMVSDHMETMYKIAHMSHFSISLSAFMLLFQMMGSGENLTDRFFTAFYRKLLDPCIGQSPKQALFFNLTFKVMKSDSNMLRVQAFARRLLQMCMYWAPTLICATLYLLSEIIKLRPALDLTHRVVEEEEEVAKATGRVFDDDSEDDDCVKDVPLSDQEDTEDHKPDHSIKSSWVHRHLIKVRGVGSGLATGYDPLERNPLKSGVDKSNVWELAYMAQHHHPSVALFAQTLLQGQLIKYPGDPLKDFTLIRFLDRFVFRNPKKDPVKNRLNNVFSKRDLYQGPRGVKQLAPDSKDFVSRPEETVPLEERFIYRFFKERRAREADEADSDAASVQSEEVIEAIDLFSSKDGKGDDGLIGAEDLSEDDKSEDEMEEDEDEGEDLDELSDENSDSDSSLDMGQPRRKKKKKDHGVDMFASVDDFASLIDDGEDEEELMGTSEQLLNRDSSSSKQIKWEQKRPRVGRR